MSHIDADQFDCADNLEQDGAVLTDLREIP